MLKHDLTYIQSTPSELETFLLSNDVVRVLPDVTFSAGGILLAHKRITAGNQLDQIQADWDRIEQIRGHWKVAWAEKCRAEFKMRLRQWGDFILGMAPDKSQPSTEFRHQVRIRVIIQLFEDSLPEIGGEFKDSLERKDKILTKWSVPNDFIWEKELREGFPQEKFWYLYRAMQYEKAKS